MFYLKRNLPAGERIARLGLGIGLALVAWRVAPTDWLRVIAWLAAATAAATAMVGFCPACALVGRRPIAGRKP